MAPPSTPATDTLAAIATQGLSGRQSKFAVLGAIPDDDVGLHSIELLKKKIKDILGPSGSHGAPKDRPNRNNGKAKLGPSSKPTPGPPHRTAASQLVIGRPPGPSSTVATKSLLKSGGPSGITKPPDRNWASSTQLVLTGGASTIVAPSEDAAIGSFS